MPRLTTPTLYRILGPAGPVGEPGPAHPISRRCTELNDAANPDEGVPRVVYYRVERVVAPPESRIIIAGGRDFADWEVLCTSCDRFIAEHVPDGSEITIISGTANGADELGERYANARRHGLIRCPAKWDEVEGLPSWQVGRTRHGKPYNKRAGLLRNEEMGKIATHAVLFWNGVSTGTKHMIGLCEEMGLPHEVVHYGDRIPQRKVLETAQMRIDL